MALPCSFSLGLNIGDGRSRDGVPAEKLFGSLFQQAGAWWTPGATEGTTDTMELRSLTMVINREREAHLFIYCEIVLVERRTQWNCRPWLPTHNCIRGVW